jgi:hypothetical protein
MTFFNNPLSYIDPDGEFPLPSPIGTYLGLQKITNLLSNYVKSAKLTMSTGKTIGVKVGIVGLKINFGSKEVGSLSGAGLVKNETNGIKTGFELSIGVLNIDASETIESKSTDINVETSFNGIKASIPSVLNEKTTTKESSITILGFEFSSVKKTDTKTINHRRSGGEMYKSSNTTRTNSNSFKVAGTDNLLEEVSNNLVKKSKLSVSVGVTLELKGEIK